MFYIRPTLGLADSTSGGVLVVSNTETEKNRNRVLELKTEPNRTGSSNLGTEPALLNSRAASTPYHRHCQLLVQTTECRYIIKVLPTN